MAQIIENKGLSEKARANLERNEQIRKASEQSRWIKMGRTDPMTLVLLFDAEKIEWVEREFNGRTSRKFEYKVVDPNNAFGEDRILALGKTWAAKVDALLVAGQGSQRLIKVTRFGQGIHDTRYEFEAA